MGSKQIRQSRLFLLSLLATMGGVGESACSSQAAVDADGDSTGRVDQSLLFSRNVGPWPDKRVSVCWNDASRARSDFDSFAESTQSGVSRSWTQATGLMFYDWGVCPANTNGMVVARMGDSGQSHCNSVGYSPDRANDLYVTFGGGIAMHEMGHCIGIEHEHARTDFPQGICKPADPIEGKTYGTPPDRYSIMASAGYCGHYQRLSYWDEVGIQKVYGFHNFFEDVTGDGRADAIVMRTDGVYVRPANSAATGFDSPVRWTNGPDYSWGNKGTFLADVSGDGKSDLVLVNDDWIMVRKSNGTSFGSPVHWTMGSWWGELETHVADVTGDCRADVITINNNDTQVRAVNSGVNGFAGPTTWGPSYLSKVITLFGNVSHRGAGRGCWADAVFVGLGDQDGVWVATSTGSGFSTPASWASGSTIFGTRATQLRDVDGDGLSDLVMVFKDQVYVRRSLGDHFGDPEVWSAFSRIGDRGVFSADMTGDGKADLAVVNNDKIRITRSSGTGFGAQQQWTETPYFGDVLFPVSELDPVTGLVLAGRSGSAVSLSWGAVTRAAGYKVERATLPDVSTWSVLTASNPSTSYTDVNADAFTTYRYRVTAVTPNAAGYTPATISSASVSDSLYIIQADQLYRVDNDLGEYGLLQSTDWAGATSMTELNANLYVIQADRLQKVDPRDGSYAVLGGPDWPGPTTMAALNSKLYVTQGTGLWEVDAATGAFVRRGSGDWTGATSMTAFNGSLYIIQASRLHKVNPSNGTYTVLGGVDWAGDTTMKPLNSKLYVTQGDALWEVNPSTGSFVRLQNGWDGTSSMTTLDGKLYIIQHGNIWEVEPTTMTSRMLGPGWDGPTVMAAIP